MKLWVAVATFNRKTITEIVIRQLVRYRADAYIHVTDDYSTDYDVSWLKSLGPDEVVRPPEKWGIDKIRVWNLRQFLATGYDLCYLTDNDAYHDPVYVDVLKTTYDKFKKPVSIYNTPFHRRSNDVLDDDVIIRTSMPGISHLYDRRMVERILAIVDKYYSKNLGTWDYKFPGFADTHTVTTSTSYVQHYGAYGLHNGPNDYDTDVAINPSQYLIDTREDILAHVEALSATFNYCGLLAQQNRKVLRVFRAFFAEHPDIDLVLEFGTGYGGFAMFLKDETDKLGAKFVTYETNTARVAEYVHPEFMKRDIDVRKLNVLTEAGKASILAELAQSRRALILCDASHNAVEFNTFAAHVRPGDILMAHDYAPNHDVFQRDYANKIWNWLEVDDAATIDARKAAKLVPYYPDFNSVAWLCVVKEVE